MHTEYDSPFSFMHCLKFIYQMIYIRETYIEESTIIGLAAEDFVQFLLCSQSACSIQPIDTFLSFSTLNAVCGRVQRYCKVGSGRN